MGLALRACGLRLANRAKHRAADRRVTTVGTRQLRDQIAGKIERCTRAQLCLRASEEIPEHRPPATPEWHDLSEILVPCAVGAPLIADATRVGEQAIEVKRFTVERRLAVHDL